jgi:hypothetical protein
LIGPRLRLRESKGTPKAVNIYRYLFNIDTETLSLIVEDRAGLDEACRI